MLFFANIWGFIFTYRRAILVGAAGLVLLISAALLLRSCSKPPKLDEQEIQKGEQAIKEQNDKELRDILVESDKREAEAIAPSVNAKAEVANAVNESRQKWENANRDELQAEFDRRRNQ